MNAQGLSATTEGKQKNGDECSLRCLLSGFIVMARHVFNVVECRAEMLRRVKNILRLGGTPKRPALGHAQKKRIWAVSLVPRFGMRSHVRMYTTYPCMASQVTRFGGSSNGAITDTWITERHK